MSFEEKEEEIEPPQPISVVLGIKYIFNEMFVIGVLCIQLW